MEIYVSPSACSSMLSSFSGDTPLSFAFLMAMAMPIQNCVSNRLSRFILHVMSPSCVVWAITWLYCKFNEPTRCQVQCTQNRRLFNQGLFQCGRVLQLVFTGGFSDTHNFSSSIATAICKRLSRRFGNLVPRLL